MPLDTRSSPSLQQLEQKIHDILSREDSHFALAFKDLSTQQTILHNARDRFHAASTMKTPVMIEVYRQAAAGKLSLQDKLTLKNVFNSIIDNSEFSLNAADDSEPSYYDLCGTDTSIAALVYKMITESSNIATNMLLEIVTPADVTATMRQLGANDIEIKRGLEDQKAFDQGLINTTTAYDLMLIFEKLANGMVVSPAASEQMVNVLLDQKFRDIIPAQLPVGTKVAHKTGNITGINHDSAIVYLADGRAYVLILLSKTRASEEQAKQMMATVSRSLYDYMCQ
ncbi:class A beta-lactamase-related serine hydrolase [Neisseriaceae bacterium TC5R-5]|nr:class A beta-lactamase-related serine hydrolase [Neisseriaceae bacterium TC5R-5]